MEETTRDAVVVQPAEASAVKGKQPSTAWGDDGIKLATLEDAWRFAQAALRSGFLPDGFKSPESVVIALQAGSEIGLTPWQSIQSIVPIKGVPTVRIETASALVEGSALLEPGTKFRHRYEGDGASMKCIVTSLPRGSKEAVESEFSIEDAVRAGLVKISTNGAFHTQKRDGGWGDWGAPWSAYPKRMLLARAKGFHIRDYYPTAIRRMPFTEETSPVGGPIVPLSAAIPSAPAPDPLFPPIADDDAVGEIQE